MTNEEKILEMLASMQKDISSIKELLEQFGCLFHVVFVGLQTDVAIRNSRRVEHIGRRFETMEDSLGNGFFVGCVLQSFAHQRIGQMYVVCIENDLSGRCGIGHGNTELLAVAVLVERIGVDHVFAPDQIGFTPLESKDTRLIVGNVISVLTVSCLMYEEER